MDIMKLMKQAQNLKKMQKEVSKSIIQEEVNGAKLVITGSGDVKSFEISQELYSQGPEQISQAAAKVIDTCFKKQMDLYKSMAKDAMGGMDLSGFMG